jgi:peroxiredoxin
MAKAVAIIHEGMGHDGGDTNVPTTFLVDGDGYVRHLYRPERFITRLRPEELLAIINETWKP